MRMNYTKPIVFGILVHIFCVGHPTGESPRDNAGSGYQSNKISEQQPPLVRQRPFIGDALAIQLRGQRPDPLNVGDVVTVDDAGVARVNDAAVAPTVARRVNPFYMLDDVPQVGDSQD